MRIPHDYMDRHCLSRGGRSSSVRSAGQRQSILDVRSSTVSSSDEGSSRSEEQARKSRAAAGHCYCCHVHPLTLLVMTATCVYVERAGFEDEK